MSYKIEDFEGRDGKPGRKVKLDINNAVVDAPKVVDLGPGIGGEGEVGILIHRIEVGVGC